MATARLVNMGDRRTAQPATAQRLMDVERSLSSLRVVQALAIVAALWWGQVVLIPLVLSVLISYALEPLIARLEQWHVMRSVAVPVVLTILLAIAGIGAFALRGEAIAFANRLPDAAHTIAQAIPTMTGGTHGTIARVQQAARELESVAHEATRKDAGDGVTPVRIEEPTFKWSDWLWQGGHGAIEFGGQMLAVLCLVYYLLAAGDLYKRKLVRVVPTLSNKKITVRISARRSTARSSASCSPVWSSA